MDKIEEILAIEKILEGENSPLYRDGKEYRIGHHSDSVFSTDGIIKELYDDIGQEKAKLLSELLDAQIIKPEYHNLMVMRIKELKGEL